LAHHHLTLAATMLGRRDQELDQGPFLVGQVARVAQLVTVIAGTVFRRPHLAPHEAAPEIESQVIRVAQAPRITDSNDSQSFRTNTETPISSGNSFRPIPASLPRINPV